MIRILCQSFIRLKFSYCSVLCIFLIIVTLVRGEHLPQLNSSVSRVELGDSCEQLLERYAAITANFTKCVIRHARPIQVCEKCVEEYSNVVNSHENITKLYEDTGEACKAELINVDRLEVIEASFAFVKSQWKKAACEKCFLNGNKTGELNPVTLQILDLYNKTENCINSTDPKSNNTSAVCEKCSDEYVLLNTFYDSKGSYTAFCMDIIDMMNLTRTKWSMKLGCCTDRKRPSLLFFISSLLICITPLIFYLLIWLCSKFSLDNITNESRWIQNRRFHRLSTSM